VYALLAVALLAILGPELGSSAAPLADAVAAAGVPWLEPVVRIGAAVAALGSLLSLILGISRTGLAMARDGHLPSALAVVHPRFAVPHRAEMTVGVIVAAVAALADVRAAIGFSSFAVLVYYAIANACALTLPDLRLTPAIGLAGCLLLAVCLPAGSVIVGAAVVAAGAVVYAIARRW
jgi:APA family basic amino acid/polyamine antiporter